MMTAFLAQQNPMLAMESTSGKPPPRSAKAPTPCSYYHAGTRCKFGSKCHFNHEGLGQSQVRDWGVTLKEMQEGASASLEQQLPERNASLLASKGRSRTPLPAGLQPWDKVQVLSNPPLIKARRSVGWADSPATAIPCDG